MRVTAICIQKGGTAKTTTAWCLAEGLKAAGKRVLCIDADSQGSLGILLGVPDPEKNLCDLMINRARQKDCIATTGTIDVIGGGPNIASLEGDIAASGLPFERQCSLLRDTISAFGRYYDNIIIDLPPATGYVMFNAMTAADDIIIPLVPDTMAVSGLKLFIDNFNEARKSLNPRLKLAGILITRAARTKVSKDMVTAIQAAGTAGRLNVYETIIPENAAVAAAQFNHESLLNNPKAKAGQAYQAFVAEYLMQQR